jgi:hypothetical protein
VASDDVASDRHPWFEGDGADRQRGDEKALKFEEEKPILPCGAELPHGESCYLPAGTWAGGNVTKRL